MKAAPFSLEYSDSINDQASDCLTSDYQASDYQASSPLLRALARRE